jgi:putative inorganic carbon (HCO3(-)) transporter
MPTGPPSDGRITLAATVHSSRLGAAAAIAVASVITAFAVTAHPLGAVAVGLAVVTVALAASRLPFAVGVLVASFYFEGYLTTGTQFVSLAKLVGVLAFAAWFLAWAIRRRPLVGDALFWPILGMGTWIVVSLAVSYDPVSALLNASRYLMFFVVAFLVVQAVDGSLARANTLIDVAVASGSVAALVGLVSFYNDTAIARATGSNIDPNDFALLLAVTVPLAIYRVHSASGRTHRVLAALALVILLVTVAATLSRGGVVALLVATVWALLTRRLSLRWVGLTIAVIAVLAAAAFRLDPAKLSTSLEQKQRVAEQNVDSRLLAWQVAVAEFSSAPLLGVGPGNYEGRFAEFGPPIQAGDSTVSTHNAYLSILAELGAPGLACFLIYLLLAWARLRRRCPTDPAVDGLRSALAASLLATLAASMFLTAQYYAPLWLLPALGATVEPRQATADQVPEHQ